MNRDLLIAMDYVDVVPGFKVSCDFGVRYFIGCAQVGESLAGKDDTPAKRIVRPVAFMDRDVVRRIALLHQDREVQSRRSAADDVDFHFKDWLNRQERPDMNHKR